MKKRYMTLIAAAAAVLVFGIGVTIAYLVATSHPVRNVFTVGSVKVTLEESTGQEYPMAPGVSVAKKPTVTVLANSESCWLFVRMQPINGFDEYCTYTVRDGWTALPNENGVYYRYVSRAANDQMFNLLQNDCVTVKDTVTEEQLAAITQYPTLDLTAYAVQETGFATASDAWQSMNH